MRRPARGMTLIEIMVVTFILAMIAAIVVVNVRGTKDTADRQMAEI